MTVVLAVAPHPDDETLGCGGALLRHLERGDRVHWLIATKMTAKYPAPARAERARTIKAVARAYGFASTIELGLPTAQLDALPRAGLVARFAEAFRSVKPAVVYVPHPGEAHTDHRIVFEAVSACSKWFRSPDLKRVLAYETLSETGFSLPSGVPFAPNHFVDVSATLAGKLRILSLYASELGKFPFPRSAEAVNALAAVRGAAAGVRAAEAFELLAERS